MIKDFCVTGQFIIPHGLGTQVSNGQRKLIMPS